MPDSRIRQFQHGWADQAGPGAAYKPEVIVLREGDSVRISFPGAPNLNSVQLIRRDGRITLPLIGEFQAAGLTPPDIEKELLKLYGLSSRPRRSTLPSNPPRFLSM